MSALEVAAILAAGSYFVRTAFICADDAAQWAQRRAWRLASAAESAAPPPEPEAPERELTRELLEVVREQRKEARRFKSDDEPEPTY